MAVTVTVTVTATMADARAGAAGSALPIAKAAILSVLGIWLAWTAGLNAYANVNYARNPKAALHAEPGHAAAMVNAIDHALVRDTKRVVRERSSTRATAVASLRRQAINPIALRLVGMSSENIAASRKAFYLGDRMSHRDLLTQLWLIEDAVAKNDATLALVYHDSAMRVNEAIRPVIFPVLTQALEDPALWAAFAAYMKPPAPWLADFWRHAVRQTGNPVAFAKLAERNGGLPRTEVFSWINAELLKKMADSGSFREAARFYASLPDADPAVVDDAAFTKNSVRKRLEPFTWDVYAVPGVWSAFVPMDNRGTLALNAKLDPAMNAAIARKLLMLKPGSYRFGVTQWVESASEGASAAWELRCGGVTGAVLWRSETALTERQQRLTARLSVPGACAAATLRVEARAGEGSLSTDIYLTNVALAPVAVRSDAQSGK